MADYRVNVYEDEYCEEVVGRVKYTQNLDYWDGRNWTSGSTGRHKGLAKLKDGRYVLIHGTQWQGERDWAEIISEKRALNEVLKPGSESLLDQPRFKGLRGLAEAANATEATDDEE